MAVRGDISSIPKGLLPVHDLWILHFNRMGGQVGDREQMHILQPQERKRWARIPLTLGLWHDPTHRSSAQTSRSSELLHFQRVSHMISGKSIASYS
jgi:hypothetical protein